MKPSHWALALAIVAASHAASAQQPRLFRSDEMSERALIDALILPPATAVPSPAADAGAAPADPTAPAPAAEAEEEGAPRTRSIRPRVLTPALPRLTTAPAPRPSASLLIMFETNSAELTGEAKRNLDIVGRALVSDQLSVYRFAIEGHADPRGGAAFNQRLSEQRAEAVRQYLVQRHGIPEARLAATGKGDRELLNPHAPTAAENRRVTIVNTTN